MVVDDAYFDPTKYLTVAEVAARYRTTETHVRGLVKRKKIPFQKVDGVPRFDEAAVEKWTKREPDQLPSVGAVEASMGRLFTKQEVADWLRISSRTLEGKMRRREVPFVRVASRIRFTEAHLAEIIALAENGDL
jgi:excisionase family DNA binding protein